MKIILASESEWRKELFAWLDLPFDVMPSNVDESIIEWDEPEEVVATLAAMKARAVAKQLNEQRVFGADDEEGLLVVGADTVISIDGEIIGKPDNREHAKAVIQKLSGKKHEVWTGVCLINTDTNEHMVEVARTEVEFRPIGEEELERYLNTNEWQGKAGGYQIQGAIKPFIKDLKGSYTNVIGLPLLTLVDMFEQWGVYVDQDVVVMLESKLGYKD
jgi:septum formation protein